MMKLECICHLELRAEYDREEHPLPMGKTCGGWGTREAQELKEQWTNVQRNRREIAVWEALGFGPLGDGCAWKTAPDKIWSAVTADLAK